MHELTLYTVAPGVEAELCTECWLRPAPRELAGPLITHEEWVAAGGHRQEV